MKKCIYTIICFAIITTFYAQNYVPTLPNYEAYKAFRGKPLSDKFSNIESVKIIYDLNRFDILFQ